MSLATRSLVGVAAGLAVGALTAAADAPWLRALPGVLGPAGQLWVRALQMAEAVEPVFARVGTGLGMEPLAD